MRSIEIGKILFEYLISGRHKNKILGKRIREACEKLGPVFVKFGQMLSTRYDFLSEEDCEELQSLLDNAPPMPYSKVEEIFIHDFGKIPEELFLEFDKTPIASASISQVYRGKLHTGEEVAIKVRRPYMGRQIEEDMNILIRFASLSKIFSKKARLINLTELAKEMKEWTLKEIDFKNERKNMLKIKKEFHFCDEKPFKNYVGVVCFPRPYEEYSSKNVITMDYIEGVPMLKKYTIEGNPDYDAYNSLKAYFGCSIYALFNNDPVFLQADPHPANIFILKKGDAANVDYGMIAEFKGDELKNINDLFIAVYLRDLKRTTNMILDICGKKRSYYPKLVPDVRKYLDRVSKEDVAFWFIEPLKFSLKHNMRFPKYFTAFGRAVIVMDGTVKYLDNSLKTLDMIGEELRDEAKKRIINNLKEINFSSIAYNVTEKLKKSPEMINRAINRYSEKPERVIQDIKSIINEFTK